MTRPCTGNVNDPAFAYLGGLGCAAQMDTNRWEYISSINDRVPGVAVRHMDYRPFDMPAIRIFKVWGGKIHEIEAVGWTAPYCSMRSGGPAGSLRRGAQIQACSGSAVASAVGSPFLLSALASISET